MIIVYITTVILSLAAIAFNLFFEEIQDWWNSFIADVMEAYKEFTNALRTFIRRGKYFLGRLWVKYFEGDREIYKIYTNEEQVDVEDVPYEIIESMNKSTMPENEVIIERHD